MRINVLTGLLDGGAANAAKQLHTGLRKEGIDATLYYGPRLKPSPQPDHYRPAHWHLGPLERISAAISFRFHRQGFKRKVRHRPRGMEIFTSPRGGPRTPWPPLGHDVTEREIIHLHWVAKFIDYPSFFASLPEQQPVIWTLHDMNPFTGGCHFTEACERFTEGCGNCPQLPENGPRDISHEFFRIKRQSLSRVNLHVVTASRWMQEMASRSPIFENVRSYHRIPYGLPLGRCQPVERAQARRELGIDPDAFVFAFGAVDVQNRRKGAALLLESLQHLGDLPNVLGLVLGGGKLPECRGAVPPLKSMGNVREIERRIFIYSACDLFVLPSTEDNMPLTGLEALASGTPIVAFNAGGLPDFVRPEETGLLATNGDAMDLASQIRRMVESPDRAAAMGENARQIALDEYSEQREARDYIELYRSLL